MISIEIINFNNVEFQAVLSNRYSIELEKIVK